MNVKVTKLKKMIIAGFSAETTPENNDKDLGRLYDDFLHNRKKELLNSISKNEMEYYGVIWYTKLHEKYKYLLGQKVNGELDRNDIEIKIIPVGEYCYKKYPPKYDVIKAFTDLFYKDIPEIGYKPIEKNDVAFEYYPNGFDGEYEIWALVEKI